MKKVIAAAFLVAVVLAAGPRPSAAITVKVASTYFDTGTIERSA